jgi:hypothetical protein
MRNSKIVSLVIMFLGVVFFGCYLWWGHTYTHKDGLWGTGIWLVSVGTFLTGAITYFEKDYK